VSVKVNIFNWPRWRSLLYVGAGDGGNIEPTEMAGLDRVTLVEPHPDLSEALAKKFSGQKAIEVLRAAVCPSGKPASLTLFNLAELSSLRAPTGILNLFPGLRPIDEVFVETHSLESLLEMHSAEDEGLSALVLDAPGLEKDALGATSDETLQAFDEIVVFTGDQPLYDNAGTADEIISRLTRARFELATRSQDELGREQLTFLNNRKALALERSLVKSEAALEKLRTDYEKLQASNEALAQESTSLKEKQDKLGSECDEAKKAREKSEAALEKLRTDYEKLQASNEALAQEAKKLKAENKQFADTVATLESAGDEKAAHAQTLELEVVRMEAQLELIRELMRKDDHGA
jgi:FkbM family methyltransferase